MPAPESALVIVDMQNYYLDAQSSYCRYFNHLYPGSLDYILNRCRETVIPNIKVLTGFFREQAGRIIFLRLCSHRTDRSDLHRFFAETWAAGKHAGFDGVYPLADDPMAGIIPELRQSGSDLVVDKTTFSPFTSTDIHRKLAAEKIKKLVLTGLATSQCVDTTARDASDFGYEIIFIEDAIADYDDINHTAALISSRGVCGGTILSTGNYIASYR